jgi:hypothetical protein
MPELTMEELRKIARENFGRDLTDAEAQSFARALARLAPVADRLLWWQSQLGETEPATIYSLSNEVRHDR